VKEKEKRKREEEGRGPEASCRASHTEWTGKTESHHVRWRDSGGVTQAMWHGGA
jgi:hypothetical protein